MKLRRLLIAIIAVELIVGCVLAARQWLRPGPPLADLSFVDPLAASDLSGLADKCRSPEDWARLGEAYLAYGYFREAEATLRRATELEPSKADRFYDWAFALERIGLTEEANQAYERAIQLKHPRPGDCWFFIGRNWLRRDNFDGALQAFQKAGDQPSARYEYARLLVRAGKEQEAIPILDRLASEYPKAVQPYQLRHRIEVLKDDLTAAFYADRAAHAPEVLPTPWNREFIRLELAHDRLGPGKELLACKELLSPATSQHRLAEAETRLRSLLDKEWDPLAVDLIAKIEKQRGRADEAIRLYQSILDRAGPSTLYLTKLGDAYLDAGRMDEAADAWSRAVKIGHTPDAKDQYYQQSMLAGYYQERGDKEAARRHYAQSLFEKGHEAFWKDNLSGAQQALAKAVELEPNAPYAWYYLGETQQMLGQKAAARQAYQRCLEVDPNFTRAQTSLALLDFLSKSQGNH